MVSVGLNAAALVNDKYRWSTKSVPTPGGLMRDNASGATGSRNGHGAVGSGGKTTAVKLPVPQGEDEHIC
jgi:hypothetical protein